MTPERITCPLPPTYLLRDVTVRIERVRRNGRWQIVGVDGVDNAWPLAFDGFTGSPRFATKAGAAEFLANHDGKEGTRLIARAVRP
jgi:hypothetical protein